MFWPRPAKLKPEIVSTESTAAFSFSMKWALELLDDLQRALLRRAGRQLDLADDEALVLVGEERRRQPQEEHGHGRDDPA